jgi:hypothetical protein
MVALSRLTKRVSVDDCCPHRVGKRAMTTEGQQRIYESGRGGV